MFDRITVNPQQMGGVPCIRGLRIPVATVVRMVADQMSEREILEAYPDLQAADVREALRYAAEAVRERQLPVIGAARASEGAGHIHMSTTIRSLIDNALSPALAEALRGAGFDCIHVRDRAMGAASDEAGFELSQREQRVIVSADTDFGTILAQRRAAKPPVILFRRNTGRRPPAQFDLLMKNMPQIAEALEAGSVVAIEAGRIRLHALPFGGP